MFSFGSKSRSAFTTVRPPMPESKTPIGRESLMQRGNSSQRCRAATTCRLSLLKGEGRGEGCLLTSERSLTLVLSLHQGRGGISCAGCVGRFANAPRLWMIDRNGGTSEEIRSKVG